MADKPRSFTPEQIEKGEEVTAYFNRHDLPLPDGDETKTHNFRDIMAAANKPVDDELKENG